MKIVLCTTPIRSVATSYPPFGSMALIQSLRSVGHDPYFYDIDGLRPTFEEAVSFIIERAPDVLGISAVVSTAYAYTKKLVLAVKEGSPRTKIVVGGNLAASSEILLRFCGVDVCGIGEGENTIVNLVSYWEEHHGREDYSALHQVKGIAYLDSSDEMVFTGYDVAIPGSEFLDPDWSILDQYSKIENFLTDPLERKAFVQDPRSYEPHRLGKKVATVPSAKGCVAKCTFCHRWDKGYRNWSVDRVIDNIKHLKDKYNVGFILFGDENFGSDRRNLNELLEALKPLDILFSCGGVRVASVDLEMLKKLKDSGCVSLFYGMETGSQRILDIMEKNATVQKNIDAARWTYEAGLYTIYQFVLAMPGEDEDTIKETTEFVKSITEFLHEPPHKRLSINFIQALPGTPVYEHARNTGKIGPTLEDEERYLIGISDIDAADDLTFLNFTKYPYFSVRSWRHKITFDAETNWYKKRGWKSEPAPDPVSMSGKLPESDASEDYGRGGYFNLAHMVIGHPLFFRIMSFPVARPLRALYPLFYFMLKDYSHRVPKRLYFVWALELALNKLRIKRPRAMDDFRSLRRVVKDEAPSPVTVTEINMQPMRDGR